MRAVALSLAACFCAARASDGAAVTLDVALDARGAAGEPPVTAAELRAFMRSTTDTLAEHGAVLAEHGAVLAVHGAALAVHGAALAELRGTLAVHGAALAELGGTLAAHGAALAELAESTITPAVAARVEACARVTAIFAGVVLLAGKAVRQCSAVPLPADALGRGAAAAAGANSSFFLSSAHCFFNKTTGLLEGRRVLLFVGGVTHECALLDHFFASADALDLAVISCAQPVPVPPTRVSASPFEPHARAVLLGHSLGLHADNGASVLLLSKNETNRLYAPHVRFTRLVASMQTPDGGGSVGGAAAASRGFTEDGLFSPLPFEAVASSPSGFVGVSPARGMSGGAVVDTRCGVFGVTERSSVFAQGGQFVRLTPAVVARVAAAVAGAGAGAA
jgi:hypothetical protein